MHQLSDHTPAAAFKVIIGFTFDGCNGFGQFLFKRMGPSVVWDESASHARMSLINNAPNSNAFRRVVTNRISSKHDIP